MKVRIRSPYLAAITLSLAGALVTLPVLPSLARGGPAAGVGVGIGAGGLGANAGVSGGMNGNFGGQSSGHISASGLANSNGPDASDRDFGSARAEDRMSAEGLKHSKGAAHARTHADTDTDSDVAASTSSKVRISR